MKVRKKPIETDAIQWFRPGHPLHQPIEAVKAFKYKSVTTPVPIECEPHKATFFAIRTLEGLMRVDDGSWVVRGVEGEFWAVKDSIFRKTYEPDDQHEADSTQAKADFNPNIYTYDNELIGEMVRQYRKMGGQIPTNQPRTSQDGQELARRANMYGPLLRGCQNALELLNVCYDSFGNRLNDDMILCLRDVVHIAEQRQ